ncbi:MAG TPA: LysR family transcriptional regulator [Gammaproteobacteria bacterium]|nr:LysR family transcriptional regulator [Gammaproteobacteria bacterium]
MNIESMRAFLEIASTGSFQNAAERLHVTQSAISARIKSLEQRLNRVLFARKRSGIELTDAGIRFQRHAQNCVQSWERARQEIALPAGIDNLFSLGLQINLWDRLALSWSEWMDRQAPQTATRIVCDYSEKLVSQVREGSLDVALVYSARQGGGLVIEEFDEQELILVSTEPRALNVHWTPGFIYVDWTDDFSSQYRAAYADSPQPRFSVSSSIIALEHILKHGGSAYLARDDIGIFLDAGKLHRVENAPVFLRKSHLVYLRDSPLGEIIDTAINGLHELA